MLDSKPFRYLRNLERIEVDGAEYAVNTVLVPAPTGYPITEVRLVGVDGSTLSSILPLDACQTVLPSCVIKVPPSPAADRISCSLGSGAKDVEITLDLPRIWWRLEDGRADPGDWRDTPILMTREEFRNHAYANATLSVLSKRWTKVCAGFDDLPNQPYSRKIKDNRIEIPLAHFADHSQIDRRLNADAHFNLEYIGQGVALIVISADPMPEIVSFTAEPETISKGEEAVLEWTTQNVDDARVFIEPDVGEVEYNGFWPVRPADTTRYTLLLSIDGADDIASTVTVAIDSPGERPEPRVMSSVGRWRTGNVGRWRTGKGFSTNEIQRVGLTLTEAAAGSIPIDRRRRTSHRANINAIRRMLDA